MTVFGEKAIAGTALTGLRAAAAAAACLALVVVFGMACAVTAAAPEPAGPPSPGTGTIVPHAEQRTFLPIRASTTWNDLPHAH